ncbi:MAG: protein kinase [Candidatus Nanopelagicales bacterium]|nr:protein kinase [Candidatus Nanopelagicales bacterium]
MPGYRLVRLLHRGHSFEVYEAWSLDRDCPVVVKRARPSAAQEAVRRLLREGRLLRSLTHPHLVRGYEVHRIPRPAIVLETLPGQTLAHLFEAGPIPARDVVMLGRQLTSVLGYLHGAGLVHADLKPANATLSDGLVRLMDLSLAQAPGPWRRRAGTAGYLAPEQAGRTRVTPATDVWGLGLLLLEAASGEDPFPVGCAGYDEEVGPVAAPEPLRARRRAPRGLDDLICAMTAIDPADRIPLPGVRAALWELPGRP